MPADLTRDDLTRAIVDKTGKTPEQADAFLNILGSAFARRGWVDGQPLSPDEIERNLNTFVGDGTVQHHNHQGDPTP